MSIPKRITLSAALLMAAFVLPAFAGEPVKAGPAGIARTGMSGPAFGTVRGEDPQKTTTHDEMRKTLLAHLRKGLDLPEETEWFDIDLPRVYPLALGETSGSFKPRGRRPSPGRPFGKRRPTTIPP